MITVDAPVVEKSGADLPLILGLRSMAEKQGVIELDAKKRLMTIPGPGGYEIKWAPGAIHIPLIPARSSHLMIPCDLYENIPRGGGLKPKEVCFHALRHDQPEPGSLVLSVNAGQGQALDDKGGDRNPQDS